MILHCNFEELRALASGAELVVSHEPAAVVGGTRDASPMLEQLLPRLTGDISIGTLAEQRQVRQAVSLICDTLRARLEQRVVEFHPAHEDAVTNYFDFAHVLAVLHRLDSIGEEMGALIEVMTGAPPTAETASMFTFPD